MARQTKERPLKKAIHVFWEGESEEAYSYALKRIFSNVASIKPHREKGTFDVARSYCRGNVKFHNEVSEYDELWFFFDVEVGKASTWDRYAHFRKDLVTICGKRKPMPKIRFLMSMGCVEYWFLLHYEHVRPAIVNRAEKDRVMNTLKKYVPYYAKGDQNAVNAIVQNYPTAVQNGRWTLECLRQEGMPEEEEQRNLWLFQGKHTFTTVHEAIEVLLSLKAPE